MAMVEEEHRDLHVVPPPPDDPEATEPRPPSGSEDAQQGLLNGAQAASSGADPAALERSDFVADIVADSGLLPADKLEAVRLRARTSSFSRALVEEGFA